MRRGRRILGLVIGMVVLAITIPVVAAATTIWTRGWTVHAVLTDSMAPGIPRGSVVVSQPVDIGEVETGSIIVYTHPRDDRRTVVHRVRRVITNKSGVFFETQGDGNATPDADLVPARLVRGRVENRILGLGTVVKRLSDRAVGAGLIIGTIGLFAASEVGGRISRRRGRIAALRRDREALRSRIQELEAKPTRPLRFDPTGSRQNPVRVTVRPTSCSTSRAP